MPFYIELGIAVASGMPLAPALFGDQLAAAEHAELHAEHEHEHPAEGGGSTGGQVTNVLQLLRLLLLLRLLRLLKLGRHYEGSIVLGSALKRSATALLVPCFFLRATIGPQPPAPAQPNHQP